MQFTLQLTLAALIIEGVFGYPDAIYKLVGHPVTWMGAALSWLEQRLNHGPARRLKGVLALIVLLALACLPAIALQSLMATTPRSILLTSGTLSPMDFLEDQFQLNMEYKKSIKHFFNVAEQLRAIIVKGIDK